MLEVRDITKIYNPGTQTEQRLFEHFSLTVDDGQFVAIVGSNGSGKTSLLNIICGSIPIEAGDVLVGGQSISKLKDYQRYATMGRVYQDPAAGTCPNLTMLENLSLADNKGKSYGLGRGPNSSIFWRLIMPCNLLSIFSKSRRKVVSPEPIQIFLVSSFFIFLFLQSVFYAVSHIFTQT